MSSAVVDSNAATINSSLKKSQQKLKDITKSSTLPSTSKQQNNGVDKSTESERKRLMKSGQKSPSKKAKMDKKDPLMPIDAILNDMDNFEQQKKKTKKKEESDDDADSFKRTGIPKSTTPVPGSFKVPTFNDLTKMENDNSIIYSFLERNPPGVNEMVLAYKMLRGRVDAFNYAYFEKTKLKPASLQIIETKEVDEKSNTNDVQQTNEERIEFFGIPFIPDDDQKPESQAARKQQVKAYLAKNIGKSMFEVSTFISEEHWELMGKMKPETVFKFIDKLVAMNCNTTAMNSADGNSERNSVSMDISSDDGSTKEDLNKKPVLNTSEIAQSITSQPPSTSIYPFPPLAAPQYFPTSQPPPTQNVAYSEPVASTTSAPISTEYTTAYPGTVQASIPTYIQPSYGYQQSQQISAIPSVSISHMPTNFSAVSHPYVQPSNQINQQQPPQAPMYVPPQMMIPPPTSVQGSSQPISTVQQVRQPPPTIVRPVQVNQPPIQPVHNLPPPSIPQHQQQTPIAQPPPHYPINQPPRMIQQPIHQPISQINPPNQVISSSGPRPPVYLQQQIFVQQPTQSSPHKKFKNIGQKKQNVKNTDENLEAKKSDKKRPEPQINMEIIMNMPPPPIPKIIQEQQKKQMTNKPPNHLPPSTTTPNFQKPPMPPLPPSPQQRPSNGNVMRALFSVLKPGEQQQPQPKFPPPPSHFSLQHQKFPRLPPPLPPSNLTPNYRPNRPGHRFPPRHQNHRHRF